MMRDEDKTKKQLINELMVLHQRIAELEVLETQHKQTEAALRESEARYRSLYSAMNEGFCLHEVIYDESGEAVDYRILDVNPSYEQITGLSREEAIGSKASELYGTGKPPYMEVYAKAAATEQPASFNTYFPSIDKHFSISVFSPRIGQFATIFRDITERKQAEEQLRDSEERLRILFEYAPDAYYLTDLEGNFIDGNIAAEEMVGYKRDELIGSSFMELKLLPSEQIPKAAGNLARNVMGLSTGSDEFVLNRKDCGQVIVEIRTFPVKIKDQPLVLGIAHDITKRKQAEEALRESEGKYRLIFENAREGISIYEELPDGSRKLVDCNPQYVEMSGYSREELMQISHTLKIQQNHRTPKEEAAGIEKMLAGQPFGGVFSWHRPDGKENYIEYTAAPINMGGRRFTIGIDHDITERRKAEEELRASKEMLSNILSASPGGISLVENGVIKWGNDAMVRLFGFEREEDYIGQSIRMLYTSEEEYKRVNQILHDNPERGETTQVDAKFRRKDGSVFDGSLRARPEALPNHENRVIVTISDVSWRKQAEEALRESEEKYRLVVENASEGIAVLQDEVIKFVNPRGMEISGYSKDEISSRSFLEFIHPEDRQTAIEHLLKRHRGKESPHYPFRFVDKNRNIKWVEVNAVLINWEERPATLNFFRDITEKRRMEEELLKVQKLESIGVLAGGIAHDFNNILTAVLGNTSLVGMYLETGRSRSEILERLEEADSACIQAKHLTQQLLTFSKGGAPIKELANIGEVLKDSVTFALRGSSVSCRFSIPDALWPVEVDKSQLSQVIANLVINAEQAMPGGGVIQVSAENVTIVLEHGLPLKSGEYIEIAIADQGIGIPKEHLQRVFDPFFTTKQKGSGLGLATSYSIVKKHNGYIAVESQVGVGSTFRIYLPASSEKVPMKEEGKEEEKPIMGEGKVLVMDDEEYIRDLAGEILGSIGYKVTTSTDGAEAVELYKEAMESGQPYSAVIVDLTVPGGMSGKETIQKLKQIDPEVRAIVSSGYSNDPVMADFRKYGFQGVITKPYKPRDLSEILHEVVIGSSD